MSQDDEMAVNEATLVPVEGSELEVMGAVPSSMDNDAEETVTSALQGLQSWNTPSSRLPNRDHDGEKGPNERHPRRKWEGSLFVW